MSDFKRQFMAALVESGLAMFKGEAIGDGDLHRYRVDGDKSGSLNGWYVLNLDGKPFGAFGSWKTGQSCTWTASRPETMTPAERSDLAVRMDSAERAREAEQAKVRAEAAARALTLWAKARPANNQHPYLDRKRVQAYGVRVLGPSLVVPLRDVDGELHSLQFIAEDGRKTFLTGGRKRGCYFSIGRPGGDLCICEGYATAASIHEATGYATASAFDAGNLEPVARALRGKFPRLRLILCADNDTETDGNPGLRYAEAAARAVRGFLAVPRFEEVGA
ncbi:MAG: toprim domain-containing protein [Propionivibrio sp.]|nr:toprim domain-containing protein [Propionivibrio sp.]